MLPNMSGVSEASRDSGSSEAVHDYAEIYTPSREGMNWLQGSGQGPRPPTPPLHRFPSWEAKIYQVATIVSIVQRRYIVCSENCVKFVLVYLQSSRHLERKNILLYKSRFY